MLILKHIFFRAGLALLFLSACSLPQIQKESPEINVVHRNTRFRITLPENHSTGALWKLDPLFDHTIVEDQNAVWHGNEKGIDFNFKTVNCGQTTLTLVLRKYRDTLIVKRFIVKIRD